MVMKQQPNQEQGLRGLKYAHQEEVCRLRQDKEEMKKQLDKWK